MVEVARLIAKTLTNMGNEGIEEEVRREVEGLSSGFPVPSDMAA